MSFARKLSVSVVAALALAAAPFLIAGAGKAPPRAVAASQLLETNDLSLTTYLAGATAVQGITPGVLQRSVHLDGSLRASPSVGARIAANPFGSVWSANQSVNGVQLSTGAFELTEVDIALPSEGPAWVVGRAYHSQSAAQSYQGVGWAQLSQPEIVLYWDTEEGTPDADDLLYLVLGHGFVEFKRYSASSEAWKGVNGCAGAFDFEEDENGPDTFTFMDQHGFSFVFFGFDEDSDPAKGQLWRLVSPDGAVAFVGHATDKDIAIHGQVSPTTINAGYDSAGRIAYAYDAEDRRYAYEHSTLDGVVRLTSVVAQSKTGGDWNGTPTGVETLATCTYSYYSTAESHGEPGDLKMVEITTPLSDSGVASTRKSYMRYWEGEYSASTNPGHDHELKMLLGFEGARRFDWEGDSTFDEDFLTASDGALEPYASAKIEYDASSRVDEAFANGACGCSGAGDGTFIFEYETNGSYSDGAGYDQEWASRCVVRRPNDSYLVQAFDEVGQSLSQVITDDDPDNTDPAPNRWVTKVTRNANGVVTEISWPDNVTGYTHSTGAITTSTSAGLVRTYTLETTGDMTGFVLDTKYKEGTSGSAYFESSQTLTSATKTIATDVIVVRPFVATTRIYPVKTTSPTSGDYEETAYTISVYSGLLMPENITTTLPAVSSSKNGSGSAATTKAHFTQWGAKDWEEAEDDILSFFEYTNGSLTKLVRDADTVVITPPSGWSSTSGAVHRVDTYTVDAQGRRTEETLANGRVMKTYFSRLADQRLVTLRYSDYDASPLKFWGPVDYTVTNLAGQVEVQGVISLTNNESTVALTGHVDEGDADPLTAVDLGSVAQMTARVYDETGRQVEAESLYFSIPSTYPGTEGTHFDTLSLFGYDDSGQRWRVKEASGTIRRTVHDLFGRTTESWIGTNDSSFSGGEPSGTDDMVKTEALEYDSGADDGNGYLTKRTAYVEGSDTDKRETSYSHDLRGNVLLVINATAPHAFSKLDNMGRMVAVGRFSSTANIVVGTDDPTTETSNRMALDESYYDERGRAWKTVRHKIDQDDGSDDDTLEALTWYDSTGRTIKVDGETLSKTFYDRLGRRTHEFVLAKARDDAGAIETAYDTADDVAYDWVLQERQTTYASGDEDDVVMSATISREHDDLSNGTVGALDTNADGDLLLYTAANIAGRIQIQASWYDAFGRVTDTVSYGTYGGSNFDRDGLSVPSRSDTALVTSYVYNTDGTRLSVTDPRGLETRFAYDAAGRTVTTIRNYVDGTPSSETGADDVHIRTVYLDGLRTKYWLDLDGDNVEDASDQVTTYTHGTTKGTSAGDSKIGTGHLVREIAYPDSGGASDVVSFAYNAQSQEVWKKDQAGNVLETVYDASGRQTHRRVTTVDGDFDGAVLRISTTHDSLGRRQLVTQYDNATVGSGSVLDEVKFTYSDWGDVETYEQDNDSAVGGSGVGEYEVGYVFATATNGRNTIRRKSMTLPSGAGYTLTYSSSGNRLDADASRITFLQDGVLPSPSTSIVEYEYVGVGQLVGTDYLTVDVKQEYFGGSGYDSLDRFNRVTNDIWVKDLATDRAIYDVDLTYDRNSNITLLDDNVHSVAFDAEFTMDDLDRLTKATEGDLDGNSTIQTTEREEEWTLTQSDNWFRNKLDLDGNGTYTGTDELDEERTHNTVNELTARDIDDDDTDDYTLAYDEPGNLIDDGENHKYEYDAFYRLRTVYNQSDEPVVQYRYNGLGHRIAEQIDSEPDGDLDGNDPWHHFAYNERWQMVAMFEGSDTEPTEEYLHHYAGEGGYGGASYIDDVVFRDRDTDGNGTLDERIWYAQNRHHDGVAIVDDSGHQLETVRYSSYGVYFGMPGGDADSDGDCDAGNTADTDQIQTWANASTWDFRGDMDLDGDVDNTDKSTAQGAPFSGATLGRGALSLPETASRRGYAGYVHDSALSNLAAQVRHRAYIATLGRWEQRDPVEYVDGPNMYQFARLNPEVTVDWNGLLGAPPDCPGEGMESPLQQWPPRSYLPNVWDGRCGTTRFVHLQNFAMQTPLYISITNESRLPTPFSYRNNFRSFFAWKVGDAPLGITGGLGGFCAVHLAFALNIEDTRCITAGGNNLHNARSVKIDCPQTWPTFYDYWHNPEPRWLVERSDCNVFFTGGTGSLRGFEMHCMTWPAGAPPREATVSVRPAGPGFGEQDKLKYRIKVGCDVEP